ncbi:MAG: hypothetical protein LBN93_00625 [Candidatus Symbiothrix sp.]|jgi:hypothetical protein|nr:hypothetical protein [Candidatus Symbiothrix sp.]
MKKYIFLITQALMLFASIFCFVSCDNSSEEYCYINDLEVKTDNITDVDYTYVTIGGEVSGRGATETGIVYGTAPKPTVGNSKVVSGSEEGEFSVKITGLTEATVYYFRAYAISGSDVVYGETRYCKTFDPDVPNTAILKIDRVVADSIYTRVKTVVSKGIPVLSKGICWSTAHNPTSDLPTSKAIQGEDATIAVFIAGLQPETTYYLRSYVTYAGGTLYSAEVEQKTGKLLTIAITTAPTALATSIEEGKYTLALLSQTEILEHGVVYAKTTDPTLETGTVLKNASTAAGTFPITITGLTEEETYYVRAYVKTKNFGTYYSTTSDPLKPSNNNILKMTIDPADVTIVSGLTIAGIFKSELLGTGVTIAEQGVVYSTSANPTLESGTVVKDASVEVGTHPYLLTGLSKTIYYIRSYAKIDNFDPFYSSTIQVEVVGGTGTPTDPYILTTRTELENMKNNLSASYKLAADIDLAGKVWAPISTSSSTPFKGQFNGDGYKISNISINTTAATSATTVNYHGLFGVAGDGAIIENVHIDGGTITITNDATHVGDAYVGAIVGYIYNNVSGNTIIRNCSNTATIVSGALSDTYVGGIVGYARTNTSDGSILLSNCYSNAAISATEATGEAFIGGIVGRPTVSTATSGAVTIDKCFAAGSINTGTVNTGARVGGIAGRVYGNTTASAQYIIISNCVAALESLTAASGATVHRIYASHTTNDMFTPTNNYGYADMLVKGVTESSTSTTSSAGANKTLVELQTQSTYTGLSWDFTNIWAISAGEFPHLTGK